MLNIAFKWIQVTWRSGTDWKISTCLHCTCGWVGGDGVPPGLINLSTISWLFCANRNLSMNNFLLCRPLFIHLQDTHTHPCTHKHIHTIRPPLNPVQPSQASPPSPPCGLAQSTCPEPNLLWFCVQTCLSVSLPT